MAGNWLNPAQDYLAAAKSGTDAGAAIARIINDKRESAQKLAQAQEAEANQTALGYATLASREREAEQTAAEKLQAATAQQALLTDWRNSKLEQGQAGLDLRASNTDSMMNTRAGKLDLGNRALDVRTDQGQQRIDNKVAATTVAQDLQKQALELRSSRSLSPGDKAVLQGATHSLWAAQKSLTDPLMSNTSPAYTNAVQQITDAKGVIDSFRTKATAPALTPAGTTTITSPSAADKLTGSATPLNLGGGVSIGGPTTTTGAVPTSAADALVSPASALPAATPTAGPATPQTQEELDALSSGDLYVNPFDGKTYRKK